MIHPHLPVIFVFLCFSSAYHFLLFILQNNNFLQYEYHTAQIKERVNETHLIDDEKSKVILQGPIDEVHRFVISPRAALTIDQKSMLEEDFDRSFIAAFKNGFPADWNARISTYYFTATITALAPIRNYVLILGREGEEDHSVEGAAASPGMRAHTHTLSLSHSNIKRATHT